MKKVFIISAILLGVILLFLGIYNVAFRKNVSVAPQTPVEPVNTVIVPVKTEKIIAISAGPVLGAMVDKKTQDLKYYDAQTGLVWKMDADGKGKQQITNTKVLNLKNVIWSPDKSRVLTTTQKDGQTSFYEYDYNLQKATQLKNGTDIVVWDNIGTKILYKYFDVTTKKATLNIANPDGSGWQKIADINTRYLSIAPIPLTSLISYWNFPSASQETLFQTVGTMGGEVRTLLTGKYGADYLWSPNGAMAIVSALLNKESKITTLGIINMAGEYQNLNIPTLVSKCVWSQNNKTIYYALPGGIPTDAIMPDDYQNNKFNTQDTFWKVDITTGEKSRIIESSEINGKYDSSSLFLSSSEDALYFVNKVDQKLYKISL